MGYDGIVQKLIRECAKLNYANKSNNTAVILAASRDNFDIGERNLNWSSKIIYIKKDVVAVLIRNGANVNIVNNEDSTPLILATNRGNLEMK